MSTSAGVRIILAAFEVAGETQSPRHKTRDSSSTSDFKTRHTDSKLLDFDVCTPFDAPSARCAVRRLRPCANHFPRFKKKRVPERLKRLPQFLKEAFILKRDQKVNAITETTFCRRMTCDTALESFRSILSSYKHPQVCAHTRHILTQAHIRHTTIKW